MAKNHEHNAQVSFINVARMFLRDKKWMLYAISNGSNKGGFGGKWAKDEGQVPGVPDLFLSIARGGYHGLYIEMKKPADPITKTRKGTVSEQQKVMMARLEEEGYKCVVCYGADEAMDALKEYLG